MPLAGEPNRGDWREARDTAIERVKANADDNWEDRAMAALWDVCRKEREFLVDDVRDELDRRGIVTHDMRAIGPLMLKASKKGMVEHTGEYRPSRQAQCHGNPRGVWRSLVFKG